MHRSACGMRGFGILQQFLRTAQHRQTTTLCTDSDCSCAGFVRRGSCSCCTECSRPKSKSRCCSPQTLTSWPRVRLRRSALKLCNGKGISGRRRRWKRRCTWLQFRRVGVGRSQHPSPPPPNTRFKHSTGQRGATLEWASVRLSIDVIGTLFVAFADTLTAGVLLACQHGLIHSSPTATANRRLTAVSHRQRPSKKAFLPTPAFLNDRGVF